MICASDICINEHDYCWINYENIHYKINTLQKIIWTTVISSEKNDAFIDYSFHSLLHYFLLKQGSIKKNTQPNLKIKMNNKKKNLMKRQLKLTTQSTKLQLINQLKTSTQQFFSLSLVQYFSYASSYEKDLYEYAASSFVYSFHSLNSHFSQLSQKSASSKLSFNSSASSSSSINKSTKKSLYWSTFESENWILSTIRKIDSFYLTQKRLLKIKCETKSMIIKNFRDLILKYINKS